MLLLAACEKPDASNTTSPSARALLGVTTGNVEYAPAATPPSPAEPPAGWQFELGNARFAELEDGTPALMVVMQLQAKAGTSMEVWLASSDATVVRWQGGNSRTYDGTVCFQLRLASGGEGLALSGQPYFLTVAFRAGEQVVVSRRVEVTHFPPVKAVSTPAAGSPVFRDLLGCPRGS